MTEIYKDVENEQQLCSICLFSLSEYPSIALRCKHRFHRRCFEKWEMREFYKFGVSTCPLCRRVLKKKSSQVVGGDEDLDRLLGFTRATTVFHHCEWLIRFIVHDAIHHIRSGNGDYLRDLISRIVIYIGSDVCTFLLSTAKEKKGSSSSAPFSSKNLLFITLACGYSGFVITFFQPTTDIDILATSGKSLYSVIFDGILRCTNLPSPEDVKSTTAAFKVLYSLCRTGLKASKWMMYVGLVLMRVSRMKGIMDAPSDIIGLYDSGGHANFDLCESYTRRRRTEWKHVCLKITAVGLSYFVVPCTKSLLLSYSR